MKRLMAMLLSVVLLLSMAACGVTDSTPETPEVYVPSQDIEVAAAYINGNARVVTRRTSDKDLKAMELACVYFDIEGKQLRTDTLLSYEKIECTFNTKGTTSIWTFTAPVGAAYIEAVISAVTYADETVSLCPGVSTWAQETVEAFSVDNHNKKMEELANKEAAAAEKCDAAALSVGTPADGKLELTIKNTSGKEIAEVVAYLLWFDAEGMPVEMNGNWVPNAEKISAKTLAVEEEASYTATAPEKAASVKAIVQSVTFADETVWENDYVYEWALVNYAAAK